MKGTGVQLAPMSVVEGHLSSVSLLLHVYNHLYTKTNPGPLYSLVRAPRFDATWGVLGMDDKINFFSDMGLLVCDYA